MFLNRNLNYIKDNSTLKLVIFITHFNNISFVLIYPIYTIEYYYYQNILNSECFVYGVAHKAPPLAEELLLIGGRGRKSHSPLGLWYIVHVPKGGPTFVSRWFSGLLKRQGRHKVGGKAVGVETFKIHRIHVWNYKEIFTRLQIISFKYLFIFHVDVCALTGLFASCAVALGYQRLLLGPLE